MIPKNITKNDVLKALENINKFGVAKRRESTIYSLKYKGKSYPPKYVISIANKFANGYELEPSEFGGGDETNGYLIKLGFNIYDEYQSEIKISETKDKKKTINEKLTEEKLKDYIIDKHTDRIRVATVLNSLDDSYDEQLTGDIIKDISNKADIILFPAGYLDFNSFKKISKEDLSKWENYIVELLKISKSKSIVCLGLDINNGINQLALAIDSTGIIAKARKFYPTDYEKNRIKAAKNSLDKENGYNRFFKLKNKIFYLAVCYDAFGIRHNKLRNPGVDCILNLIHGFYPRSEGRGSGDVYFARLGLAGASKQWECPAFAAVTYYRREIPEKWPSGILWNIGDENVQNWSYLDNPIAPIEIINYDRELEKAEVRIFEF